VSPQQQREIGVYAKVKVNKTKNVVVKTKVKASIINAEDTDVLAV
jgi:hypothetical protein